MEKKEKNLKTQEQNRINEQLAQKSQLAVQIQAKLEETQKEHKGAIYLVLFQRGGFLVFALMCFVCRNILSEQIYVTILGILAALMVTISYTKEILSDLKTEYIQRQNEYHQLMGEIQNLKERQNSCSSH